MFLLVFAGAGRVVGRAQCYRPRSRPMISFMTSGMPPQQQGLYDPRNEHDACGVGFIVDRDKPGTMKLFAFPIGMPPKESTMKIQVRINEEGALRNQRYAFTDRFTLVSELLQNARRAAATRRSRRWRTSSASCCRTTRSSTS